MFDVHYGLEDVLQLQDIDLEGMRFQQDGATCLVTCQTLTILPNISLVVPSLVFATIFGRHYLAIKHPWILF